jgi:hypothetical protein
MKIVEFSFRCREVMLLIGPSIMIGVEVDEEVEYKEVDDVEESTDSIVGAIVVALFPRPRIIK